jgi:CRP-like cAMP-binding protein
MTNPLVRKLSQFALLSVADTAAVMNACVNVRTLHAMEDIFAEGEEPQGAKVLLEGVGCRYKTLEDGRRQIVSFVVPGDTSDMRPLIVRRMDHSIGTLSTCRIATLTREGVAELIAHEGLLARALNWSSLVDESISREWIVNVGRRTALERMAHVFCELYYRLRAVGLSAGNECMLHVTQVTLGETLALSAVHVNRTLQELRRRKLVALVAGKLAIYDLPQLERVGLFNPGYLYLNREASSA